MLRIQSLNHNQSIINRKISEAAAGLDILQKGLQIFLICFLVLIYPLYRILPLWVGWENNILENAQVVILLLGFLVALYFASMNRNMVETKLWIAMSPFWLVLCGRELNWGRVFLVPIEVNKAHGFVFPPLKALWYSPVIYPLIFLCLTFGFYLFFKNRCYRILLQLGREKRFPVPELLIAILAMMLFQMAESDHFLLLGVRNELMEELLELLFYASLFIIQLDIFFRIRFQHARYPLGQ